MRILVASIAAMFAICLFSTPAQGRIVIGKSIAGVELGISGENVRARLGAPDRIEQVRTDRKPNTSHHMYDAEMLDITMGLDPDLNLATVVAISTTDRKQQTADGIGVGSSYRAVFASKKLRRPAHCDKSRKPRCFFRSREGTFTIIKFNITQRVERMGVSRPIEYAPSN